MVQDLGFIKNIEYLNFKNFLRKRKYSELEGKYEIQLSKKGRINGDLEVENDFLVKPILSSVEVLKQIKNGRNAPKTKINL